MYVKTSDATTGQEMFMDMHVTNERTYPSSIFQIQFDLDG